MLQQFTTREAGELLGVREWQIRRLFDDGTLPEPPRFAGKRVIADTLIATIVDALRGRGWLPSAQEAASCAK